jgi:hypothetical protein
MRRLIASGVLLGVLFTGGCLFDESGDSGDRPPGFSMDQLRAAPETLRVEGKAVTAHAELWRNFMPSVPPSGTPLLGVVDLVPADTAAGLPAPTDAYVWILNGSRAWASTLAHQGPGASPGSKRYSFGGGPEWDLGALVDVVVGLRTRPDHIDLVHAGKVPINRVD